LIAAAFIPSRRKRATGVGLPCVTKLVPLFAFLLAGSGFLTSCNSPQSAGPQAPRQQNLKVIVLGFDAATWEVATPLMLSGRLPNFMRLVSEGATGPLWSHDPTLSACVWTTIATGFRRDKHGILNFAIPGTNPPTPYTSNMRMKKAIWNILSEHNRTVGILNWWVSYPAEHVNGYLVSNYWRYFYPTILVHKTSFTTIPEEAKYAVYPPDIANRIAAVETPPIEKVTGIDFSVIEKHRVKTLEDADFGLFFQRGGFFFKKMMEQDEFVRTLGSTLYRERPVDFFAAYFETTDVVCHLFWPYAHPQNHPVALNEIIDLGGLVNKVYEFADGIIGEFMAKLDSRTVLVVCSDHGYGSLSPKAHSHKPNGMIAFFGEPVRKGFRLPRFNIEDVTPTLLNVMGLPAGADMDGKPVTGFLQESYLRSVPRRPIATYEIKGPEKSRTPVVSPVDAELIKELRALGYLK
jgi:predicted AlkP superfamily phosphohydrolase/phosphomutase